MGPASRGTTSCTYPPCCRSCVGLNSHDLTTSAKDDDIVRPILLTIFQATNVTVQNIRMINGPEWINFVRAGLTFVLHFTYSQAIIFR